MKSVITFWKKDIINKLIVLVSTVLVVGAGIIIYLLFNINSDSMFYVVIAPFIGVDTGLPTMVVGNSLATNVTSYSVPTFTQVPEIASLEPPTSKPIAISPSVTDSTPTLTSINSTPTVETILLATVQTSVEASACIPTNSAQTGKVLDVIDGNTIRVLIDGIAYTVRYIGIDVPKYKPIAEYFGQESDFKNAEYVFAKQVTLISEGINKDESGRLLRYVKVGDVFVNYEMLLNGFATASSATSACAQTFKTAQQSAFRLQIGMWQTTPAPPTP